MAKVSASIKSPFDASETKRSLMKLIHRTQLNSASA